MTTVYVICFLNILGGGEGERTNKYLYSPDIVLMGKKKVIGHSPRVPASQRAIIARRRILAGDEGI
jgi:hypothetical protein